MFAINRSRSLFGLFALLFLLTIAIAATTEEYILVAIPFVIVLLYAGWHNRNIVFLLLLIALPFSFEYSFSSNLGTDFPDEALMLFTSGLFVAYWIYSPSAVSKGTIQHPLLLILLLCFVWMIIATLFSTQPVLSIKFILAKCWYAGAFLLTPVIIFKAKKFIRISAIALTLSMLFATIIILIKHAGYGFHFESINKAVAPFFRNHVNYSAMLVCLVPVMVSLLYGEKNDQKRRWIGAAILVTLIALFFSYARGAWVALVVGSVAYWLIKKRFLFLGYMIVISISFAAVFWLKSNDRYLKFASDYQTTIFHRDFKEHLVATYTLKDVSTAERFYRWIAGVRMIKDNWLTGYGPNAFYYNYKGYTIPAFKTWVSNNPEHSTVHNYFLLTTIEQGIPGLIFLLLLLGAMLYYAEHLYKRIKDPFYRAVALTTGVIITMITVLNFLSDLIETDKIGSLFFLCIAMLIVADVNTRNGSNPTSDIQGVS